MGRQWQVNIPTVHIKHKSIDDMWQVIEDDTGKCVGTFDSEIEAVQWANRKGYDFS